VKCLICNADESEFVTAWEQWRFERCRNCSVFFTAPLAEKEVVERYTSGSILESPGEPAPTSELIFPAWKHSELARILHRLAALGTRQGRLLDVVYGDPSSAMRMTTDSMLRESSPSEKRLPSSARCGGCSNGAARWCGERVGGGKNSRDSLNHGGAVDSSSGCAESAAVKNRNRPLKTEALMKCETGAMKAPSLAEIRNAT
jgi:hypothetical protein